MDNRTIAALTLLAAVATIEAQKPRNSPRRGAAAGQSTAAVPAKVDFFAANWNKRGAWRDSFKFDFGGGW